jgi:hypothetical protein
MGGIMWDSPMHLLIIIILLSTLIPLQQILHRAGHSRWWVLVWFIPVVNWIALWVFAYTRWPALSKA